MRRPQPPTPRTPITRKPDQGPTPTQTPEEPFFRMHSVMPAVLFRMPGKTPILTLSNNAHRHADRTWLLLYLRRTAEEQKKSHPTGVRGLKFNVSAYPASLKLVAPHWGAWIEISMYVALSRTQDVAPHWGAWIEISSSTSNWCRKKTSHPTGVRGLKSVINEMTQQTNPSHPTGVRGLKSVEMGCCRTDGCRTPLGCVD